MKYGLAFALSLILSLSAIPIATWLSKLLGAIDKPVSGRWHKEPTPRLGGIAIFTGFIVASFLCAPLKTETLIVLAGGLAAFTLGILDDKFGTHPGAKFIVQLSIAFALVLFGVRIRIVPTPLAVPLSLIWVVMLTNAFNLIDNMDGLSAGTATIASLTIFGLTYEKNGQETVPILALALAGACLGFLRYNFNPARIFMGDCGSLFLGFTLSALAILGFWQDASSPVFSALTAPALIMGYAIFDTILVTVLRLKNGGYPWVGGKDHSSHRLVRLGLSEKNAMLSLYSFGVIGSLSALVIQRSSTMIGLPLVTTLTLIAIGFGWYLDKAQGKK